MSRRWQQVSIAVAAADTERAESLLRLAGAVAVTLGDDGDDPVLEPSPGVVELWPRVRLTALFDRDVPADAVGTVLAAALDVDTVHVGSVEDEDWIGGWRQSVEPIDIGPTLSIVPAQDSTACNPAMSVLLNMGLAFGTGRHATTRLCLEWLATADVTGLDVLDYGCGSGILALAALKRGARFASCTDNDEQALIATRRNAELNGMSDRIWLGTPDALPEREFGLVVANILAGTLRALAPDLARLHARHGTLVLSGVLAEHADAVIAAFAADYREFVSAERDGWIRLVATKR